MLRKPEPNFPDLKPQHFASHRNSWVLSIGIENEKHKVAPQHPLVRNAG